MRLSRIYQQRSFIGTYATALGSKIRELRTRAGLTQAELGSPLTRSFVSAVEHGRALPSLPALLLIATRLGVPPGELLEQAQWTWRDAYTDVHGSIHDTTPRER